MRAHARLGARELSPRTCHPLSEMRFSGAPRRRIVCAVVVAPWVLWALVRVAGADVVHPLVALMAFTPYAALLSLASVAVTLALRDWLLALVALAAAAALIAVVAPRRSTGPASPPPTRPARRSSS